MATDLAALIITGTGVFAALVAVGKSFRDSSKQESRHKAELERQEKSYQTQLAAKDEAAKAKDESLKTIEMRLSLFSNTVYQEWKAHTEELDRIAKKREKERNDALAQVDVLKDRITELERSFEEMSPAKLRESFMRLREELEQYNVMLSAERDEALLNLQHLESEAKEQRLDLESWVESVLGGSYSRTASAPSWLK